jgi:siroheme synthase-like protein
MNSVAANRGHRFFPMLVSLAGRKCVVAGAGKIAVAKIEGLLACGALVTVVSPGALLAIRRRASEGALIWHRRAFCARDLDGAFLAVAATNSSKANAAVFRACAARGVLCNSVDDPEHCDFIYPAVVRRGSLQIAISTGGCSPALAARLRRELVQQFGPKWGSWVELLGRQRAAILGSGLSARARKRLLAEAASAPAFSIFMRRQGGSPMLSQVAKSRSLDCAALRSGRKNGATSERRRKTPCRE